MDKLEQMMSSYQELNYVFDTNMPIGQKGLYIDGHVYLNPFQSKKELISTVAEEIGHYLTSAGDIVKQDTNEQRKQEQKARDVGATLVVTPADIVACYKERFNTVWECAEFLGITKNALEDAIRVYAKTYENGLTYGKYHIYFRPNGTVGVFELFDNH
ncbi:hypothetical protein IGI57_002423 [Enterococcus sp. DIV0213j]